ncbi:MAG: WecB/TagA/CpsF family glycosyltransferase [Sporomusaceae bacterium]|nr:WecB/TagA/CpsF family glycosyltransferase [Sporomusaceae bacterium]
MQGKVKVLGILIDSLNMEQAAAKVEGFILKKKPSLIVTANAEMVMAAQKDAALAEILNTAALVVPDGAGVVWAARYTGQSVPERVAGYDLAQRLLGLAAQKGYRVFFFGAAEEVVVKAKERAQRDYPGLEVVGVRNGFFTAADEDSIIAAIKDTKPDILLAALGVPKQEKWLAKNFEVLNVPVCMGVGGTFDVMAGAVRRAPLWLQKMNLEWLYRLWQEPGRFFRMLALPKFVWQVFCRGKMLV